MNDYTNKGIFFKNDYKEKESHPDYKGKINVEGKDFELAGWIREGQKGKFISLSVSEPYDKEKPAKEPASVNNLPDDDSSSDLPF